MLFSTIEIVSKYLMIHANAKPLTISVVRFLLGGFVLLPIALVRLKTKKSTLIKGDLKRLVWFGTLCVALTFNLFQLSIVYLKGSTSAIVFSSNPLFIAIFSALLLKAKEDSRLSHTNIAGLILGFVGVLLFSFETGHFDWNSVLGILIMIGAAISWAYFSVSSLRMFRRIGAFTFVPLMVFFGALINIPVAFLLEKLLGRVIPPFAGTFQNLLSLSASAMLPLLWLGLVGVGIAYVLYFSGLERSSVSRAGSMFYLKPVFASIFAIFILGEFINPPQIMGTLLILFSLALVLKK